MRLQMTSSEMSVFQTHRIRIYGKLRSVYQYVIQDELNRHTRLEQKLNYLLYWTLRVSEQTVLPGNISKTILMQI